MIQKPDIGGLFRNTKPIRVKGEEDDDLYSVLDKIVDGSDDIAETLSFEPGTLSIFCGSRCLHEVTRVAGTRDRLVAVFCFATRPGVRNSAQVQKLFWGRTLDWDITCILYKERMSIDFHIYFFWIHHISSGSECLPKYYSDLRTADSQYFLSTLSRRRIISHSLYFESRWMKTNAPFVSRGDLLYSRENHGDKWTNKTT